MKALVVWCEIPENVKFMELHFIDLSIIEKLKRFHGHYINGCNAQMAEEINEFFHDPNGEYKYKLIDGPLSGHHYDLVITCGIYI